MCKMLFAAWELDDVEGDAVLVAVDVEGDLVGHVGDFLHNTVCVFAMINIDKAVGVW